MTTANTSPRSVDGWHPRIIFFDLDDTLIQEDPLDDAIFSRLIAEALPGRRFDATTFIRAVRAAADELWQQSGQVAYCRQIGTSAIEGLYGSYEGVGECLIGLRHFIRVDRYRERVFERGLTSIGVDDPALAATLAAAFVAERNARQVLYPDARPALERLAASFRLGLITNGVARIQRHKFAGSGLASFFDPVVVSGELGVGKPDRAIYEHALQLAQVAASNALMVGNSLRNDVEGAENAGLRAVWVDRVGETLPGSPKSYQTVASLAELLPEVTSNQSF
jgi:putative hydrolase of the HAD superfamily